MRDRPLRFCMVTTYYPPFNFGGDGIFVHRLSNELARRGHQVEVIHCIDAYRIGARRDPAETYNDHPNVTVHGLKSPFGFLSPVATQQTGFPLFKSGRIRRILEKGFDVIHYHNISLVGGPKILEYGQGLKLYTMHEYWLICPTHILFRFNRTPCVRPYCVLCSLSYRRPPQWWRYSGLLQAAITHVDAFIAGSRFSKAIHQRMGFSVPIVHLPPFAPSAQAATQTSERALGDESERPYFLFVGRLEEPKGVQTLIPLFSRYGKARLLIAGTGSYEPALRRLAEGSANIRFLGHLSGGRLQTVYQKAVALIVPSIFFEVFGLVIIEAFSHRTPALVRNLGGMAELISESGGGVVYTTEEELSSAMDLLLADPAYRRELGLRGHEAYLKKWTAETHLEQYLALIREIETKKAAQRPECSPS